MEGAFGWWSVLYAGGGLATCAYLFYWTSRWIPKWLAANRPRDAEDWIFLPVIGLVALALALIGLWFTVMAWPVVVLVLARERRRGEEQRRLAADAEEEALIKEIREAR